MKHLGDITKIDFYAVEPVDVVTGGSPCQDLSVAGKRAGLAGERSGLYMEQIRCVKELREADVLRGRTGEFIRPRYMVWENVPGAFSSGKPKGADFAAVIEEIIKIAEPDAYVCVMPPDGGWTKSGCYYDSDGRWSIAWRVHDAQFWGVPQRRKRISLVADFGGLSAPEILFERKGLSGDFAEGRTPWQAAAGDAQDCAGADDREGAFPYTLKIRSGCEGGVAIVESYAIQGSMIGRKDKNGPQGDGINEDVSFTLNTGDRHAVAYAEEPVSLLGGRVSGTLMARDYKGIGRWDTLGSAVCIPTHARYIVRRLTPKECERLQGYPDGWTDIGDWVDSKGKKHKEADSPRYKALGNSIALPFWCILAKRISAQYERDITIGSLFDGIGGFPYAFEKCGGKALWASEIEEFPIAVTKIRFPEGDTNDA